MLQQVTHENFAEEVLQAQGPVVVDFYADWCAPCQAQTPILEQFASQRGGVSVVKVNIDLNPELANEYSVRSIPTLKVFDAGEVKTSLTGLTDLSTLNKLDL